MEHIYTLPNLHLSICLIYLTVNFERLEEVKAGYLLEERGREARLKPQEEQHEISACGTNTVHRVCSAPREGARRGQSTGCGLFLAIERVVVTEVHPKR